MQSAGSQRRKIRTILGMDMIKPQTKLVRQNEVLIYEDNEWLYFSNPFQVIVARRLEEVLTALQEMERLIATHTWYSAGFLSYEAASAFDSALQTHTLLRPARADFPYLWFGLYPEPRSVTLPRSETPRQVLTWLPTTDQEFYSAAIAKIKDYIARGKTYQVNYTLRLEADFRGHSWEFFLDLVELQNNHAAYIDTGRYVICSASPELFFQLNGTMITSRPMKGTAKRGRTTLEDHQQSDWLKHSEKNRAENVMIVDMIRNDLGKIAKTGSVQVPHLFETRRYSTLWQMTSTVTAKTNASVTDILTALFPCASITGAPKVSTMKIIAELEGTPRKIYTGAIGYISPWRKASFSVAIRTALIDRERHKAEYGIGGGIVWDSHSDDEYTEALLKAQVLVQEKPSFSLLETMLWTPKEGLFLKERHIARMLDSAVYFDIPTTREILEGYLEQISSSFLMPQRIRLLLNQAGRFSHECKPFEIGRHSQTLRACLAKEPLDSSNVFLFHKTTRREVYASAQKGLEEFDDVLLYNERGELTEFTIGNLVLELDGQLLTPPISCGALAGTFRAELIETGQVSERTISVDHLKKCTKIFRVNWIRKWQAVEIQAQPANSRLD
jgi:para-aminobenzoate synthetase / 4-amino-4-deoxychorismate lyase